VVVRATAVVQTLPSSARTLRAPETVRLDRGRVRARVLCRRANSEQAAERANPGLDCRGNLGAVLAQQHIPKARESLSYRAELANAEAQIREASAQRLHDETITIAREANRLSDEANILSEDANRLSVRANAQSRSAQKTPWIAIAVAACSFRSSSATSYSAPAQSAPTAPNTSPACPPERPRASVERRGPGGIRYTGRGARRGLAALPARQRTRSPDPARPRSAPRLLPNPWLTSAAPW
jgi:hypothetical protein